MHGVNGGPLDYGGIADLGDYYREAGLPITRLHDCQWSDPDIVDVHTIFPAFDADPDDPESYRFGKTDDSIQAILDAGTKTVSVLVKALSIMKTASIMSIPLLISISGLISVCILSGTATRGGHPASTIISGTAKEYFDLYAVTATAIKTLDPTLKVGGPSVSGVSNDMVVEFLRSFLKSCRSHNAPLDFCSWHAYQQRPHELKIHAAIARAILDEQGCTDAESHLNEWRFLPAGFDLLHKKSPIETRRDCEY